MAADEKAGKTAAGMIIGGLIVVILLILLSIQHGWRVIGFLTIVAFVGSGFSR